MMMQLAFDFGTDTRQEDRVGASYGDIMKAALRERGLLDRDGRVRGVDFAMVERELEAAGILTGGWPS